MPLKIKEILPIFVLIIREYKWLFERIKANIRLLLLSVDVGAVSIPKDLQIVLENFCHYCTFITALDLRKRHSKSFNDKRVNIEQIIHPMFKSN